MEDWEKYLNREYKDPEFRRFELRRMENKPLSVWSWSWAVVALLCLVPRILLYWSP